MITSKQTVNKCISRESGTYSESNGCVGKSSAFGVSLYRGLRTSDLVAIEHRLAERSDFLPIDINLNNVPHILGSKPKNAGKRRGCTR